jgi:dipeptidyl aminopeptidase/acylaminoacyl peptidase
MAKRKLLLLTLLLTSAAQSQTKPKLTLDEFFNSVSFPAVELSPDGNSVVIATERADWDRQIFRTDLWLYRAGQNSNNPKPNPLLQLTQSGHDSEPHWSPDGRWIAFLSERKNSSEKDSDDDKGKRTNKTDRDKDKDKDKDDKDKDDTAQIYLISPNGGEAIQLTRGDEEVHTFAWSADSTTIYYATRQPWSKSQKDNYKKEWKDVVQYRTAERGDSLFALDVARALLPPTASSATKSDNDSDKKDQDSDTTPGAQTLTTLPLRIDDLVTSPDGSHLAFLSSAINEREEKVEDYEIYVVRTPSSPTAGSPEKADLQPLRLTHNQAQEQNLHWSPDNRHIFFTVEVGDVSGPYRDLQPHLYWVDSQQPAADKTDPVTQWSKDFAGEIAQYAVTAGSVLTSARLGTEVPMYSVSQSGEPLYKLSAWPGTYELLSAAPQSQRIAFTYSSLQKPTEVYLADSPDKLSQARPITSFNQLFTERELPQGKPYRWKADDGTMIEGMLIYPPGIDPNLPEPNLPEPNLPEKEKLAPLPLFTFIHGGPAYADGNHFEADWYEWSRLAATQGWLVFEPNYRGSTGYGDKFLQQIVPNIVSRPGRDILEGIDALVKDGIADPGHLTVGGYSYGGYMTNWLLTQTTRFKAAVTGAGAIEHTGK